MSFLLLNLINFNFLVHQDNPDSVAWLVYSLTSFLRLAFSFKSKVEKISALTSEKSTTFETLKILLQHIRVYPNRDLAGYP